MDQNQRQQTGERVKATRKERGWSQERLAQEAGVSPNTVLAIEKAERQTQPGKLRPVLDALGLAEPVDGVLDLEGVPEDVRVFLKVAAQRLKVLPADRRAPILADIYPRLLVVD